MRRTIRKSNHWQSVAWTSLVGMLLAATSGCTSANSLLLSALPGRKPVENLPVARIVCIWEPAEGTGLKGLPSRGFAGQILFFAPGNPTPITVNGDVRVYVFDDSGTEEEQAKPIHRFDFVNNAWNVHARESMVGPAYYLFLPYTRDHSYRARCSLRVRYTAPDGTTVFSELAHIILPGGQRPDGHARPQPVPSGESPTLDRPLQADTAQPAPTTGASVPTTRQLREIPTLKVASRKTPEITSDTVAELWAQLATKTPSPGRDDLAETSQPETATHESPSSVAPAAANRFQLQNKPITRRNDFSAATQSFSEPLADEKPATNDKAVTPTAAQLLED